MTTDIQSQANWPFATVYFSGFFLLRCTSHKCAAAYEFTSIYMPINPYD